MVSIFTPRKEDNGQKILTDWRDGDALNQSNPSDISYFRSRASQYIPGRVSLSTLSQRNTKLSDHCKLELPSTTS